ncbi:hypothetical protein [Yoonia sp. R2-816]|uniref:hypothetical protein n=1 Tax=Yoonia sp. R2-816 TaxID=3342638 RepID=UPI00372736FA
MALSSEQNRALQKLDELKKQRKAAASEVKKERDEARKTGDRQKEISAKKVLVQLSRVNLLITNSRRSILASTSLTDLNKKLAQATSRGRKAQENLKAVSASLNALANLIRILTKLGNIFA